MRVHAVLIWSLFLVLASCEVLTPSTFGVCVAEVTEVACEGKPYCRWINNGCTISVTCDTVGSRETICKSIDACEFDASTCRDKCHLPNCNQLPTCTLNQTTGWCSSANSYQQPDDRFCIPTNGYFNGSTDSCDCYDDDIMSGKQCETCVTNIVSQSGDCEPCTISNSCNDHATTVASGTVELPGCACTCESGFGGSSCERCGNTSFSDYPHCTPCPEGKGGSNCTSCAEGYFYFPEANIFGVSDCLPCTDLFCHGSPSLITSDGSCLCLCHSTRSGPNCYDCVPPGFLESPTSSSCTVCDSGYCNNAAIHVNRAASSCKCMCGIGFTGDRCEECEDGFAGSRCDECLLEDCFGNARSINYEQTKLRGVCVCDCFGSFDPSTNCAICPLPFGGYKCNDCAVGYVGQYPDCSECDFSLCVHADTITSVNGECLCTCKNMWKGQFCDQCDRLFDETCTKCRDPMAEATFPVCASECDASIHCSGDNRTISVLTDASFPTGCKCECASPWGGNCSSCGEPYAGDTCSECSAGYFLVPPLTYPPDCRRCSIEEHCNGATTAYSVSVQNNTCVCSCRNSYTDDRCQTCPYPIGGKDCDVCIEGYSGYPNCVKTCPDCVGNFVAGPDCKCVCRWYLVGENCDRCPRGKALPFCTTCEQGLVDYPVCRPCIQLSDCDSSGTVVSVSPISVDPKQKMCYCEYADDPNYCKPPRYDANCNLCTLPTHCNQYASSVEAVNGVCVCTCQRTALPVAGCSVHDRSPDLCSYVTSDCSQATGYCRCMCISNGTCGVCSSNEQVCLTCNGWYQRRLGEPLLCEPCERDGCTKPTSFQSGTRQNPATPSFLRHVLFAASFSVQYSSTSQLQALAGMCQNGILEDLPQWFIGLPMLSPINTIAVSVGVIALIPVIQELLFRFFKIAAPFSPKHSFFWLALLLYSALATSSISLFMADSSITEMTAAVSGLVVVAVVPLCCLKVAVSASQSIVYYNDPFKNTGNRATSCNFVKSQKEEILTFLFGRGEWLNRKKRTTLKGMGIVVECYREEKYFFMFIDCLYRLGCAVVQNLYGSASQCKVFALVMVGITASHILLISLWMPWSSPLDICWGIIISSIHFTVALVLSYGFSNLDEWNISHSSFNYFNLASILLIWCSFLQVTKTAVDICLLFYVNIYLRGQLQSQLDFKGNNGESLVSPANEYPGHFLAEEMASEAGSSDVSVKSVHCLSPDQLLMSQQKLPLPTSAINSLSGVHCTGHDFTNQAIL